MIARAKQPMKMIRLRVILLSLVPLVLLGCFTAAREAAKIGDRVSQESAVADRQIKDKRALRHADEASSPDTAGNITTTKASPQNHIELDEHREKQEGASAQKLAASDRSGGSSPGIPTSYTTVTTREKVRSEDEYVQDAALNLADKHSAIKKIKICYDSEGEEWWIVLYQDAGAFYELKQYVWNIYLDEPEPFLVVDRVSRRRLENHLRAKEPNRKCRVLEPRKTGWLTAFAGSAALATEKPLAGKTTDRKRDRTRLTSAQIPVSGVKPPESPPPKQRHVKVSEKTGSRRENRVTDRGKPLGPRTERVREKRQTRENGFVSNEVGTLRHHPAGPKETRPRLSSHAVPLALPQTRRDRFAASTAAEKKATHTGDPQSLRRSPRTASRHPTDLEPTFRPASAGAEDGTSTIAGVSRLREKDLVEETQRLSSLTVRTDQLGGNRRTGPDNRLEESAGVPTYFVFAYGSKMNHPELLEWLESHGYDSSMIIDATPGILEGYDYVWNFYSPTRGGGAVNLEQKKNARVWGLLIEFRDPLLQAFDEREGHPVAYSRGRDRVAVKRMPDGKTVFAWLYLARVHGNGRRDIWPTRQYKNTIIQAARFWGFPDNYVNKLKAWKTR